MGEKLKKFSYGLDAAIAVAIAIYAINMAASGTNINTYFPVLFSFIGCCNLILAVGLRNDKKTCLSIFTLSISLFLFMSVTGSFWLK